MGDAQAVVAGGVEGFEPVVEVGEPGDRDQPNQPEPAVAGFGQEGGGAISFAKLRRIVQGGVGGKGGQTVAHKRRHTVV